MIAPTISTVIKQLKGFVTKQSNATLWQKSFHDHVVRSQKEFEEIWAYIDTNPLKWELDCFYNSK